MTEFILMYSVKFKTVNQADIEQGNLKKQSQFAGLWPEIRNYLKMYI